MINWMKRRIERSRARCHGAARALRHPRRAAAGGDAGLKAGPDARVGFGAEAKAKTLRRGADAFARA